MMLREVKDSSHGRLATLGHLEDMLPHWVRLPHSGEIAILLTVVSIEICH